MITKVSAVNNTNNTYNKKYAEISNNAVVKYGKCFVKHSVKSMPAILTLTGVWTVLDKSVKDISFTDALKGNIKNFFLPVMLISSTLLALIENNQKKETL